MLSHNHHLITLAKECGIQPAYRAFAGTRCQANDKTILSLLQALGHPITHPKDAEIYLRQKHETDLLKWCDPVVVAWEGHCSLTFHLPSRRRRTTLSCISEHGHIDRYILSPASLTDIGRKHIGRKSIHLVNWQFPKRLPYGYYRLHNDDTDDGVLIISSPKTAFFPSSLPSKQWGLFFPLYALKSRHSWGIGDTSDFEKMADWTRTLGGHFVATLPLHAGYLESPFDPSPYTPISRLFWNELYLDPRRLPELNDSYRAKELLSNSQFTHDIARLQKLDLVDYRAVMRLKRRVLEELATVFFSDHYRPHRWSFEHYVKQNPLLLDYARFRALAHSGKSEFNYHLYVQWAFHVQFSKLADDAHHQNYSLYFDFPLGVHPDGFDVWKYRARFALTATAGAPPDLFFAQGQNWGFPPLHPERLRENHYDYFIASLQSALRYATMLRIDHIMGLHRLYWIPEGASARDGAYIRYPADELYAILCLESYRHQTIIIGENLGTVPPEVNRALSRHHIGNMYILQYELDPSGKNPPPPPRPDALAGLNTHDMPPFATFWKGKDIEERIQLGYASTSQAFAKSLQFLAESAAPFLLINIEDLWLEEDPQNRPGSTFDQYPNWQRKCRYSLEEIQNSTAIQRLLRKVTQWRK